MLYEGTEEAYFVADVKRDDPDWTDHYRPAHRDIALLFIEAATELVNRLDQHSLAA
jgi:hypothetical protein